ncbi:hypothetical protein JL722_3777 [Aureococcus anophagefferens]|nr:hypothetical protein JL722_3777 [Aureococcus anophagefferens]
MEKLSLDEFEEIAAAAHVTASKTVVCPPDIHRFEVRAAFFAKGLPFVARELDVPGGANFEPAYVRLRLLGVGLRTPYDAPGWDGCKWDPFGVTTLVDREKRVVVVVNAADIVEYMDAESCNASGMYVDEYMLNAGKMSLISGARSVWGWPITWPFERRHLVKKAARLVDEMPLEDLWFSGDRRPAYAKRFFRAEASGAAQLAFLRNHLDGGALPDLLKPHYERKLERTAAYWADRKHDGPAFARAVEATRRLIRDLDEDLVKFKVGKKSDDGGDADAPQGVGEWLGGDKLSVGDCYWHVAAARLVGLGLGHMLDRYPRAGAYANRVLRHPELRKATYLWAGADDFPLPLLGPVVREVGGRVAHERHAVRVLRAAPARDRGGGFDVASARARLWDARPRVESATVARRTIGRSDDGRARRLRDVRARASRPGATYRRASRADAARAAASYAARGSAGTALLGFLLLFLYVLAAQVNIDNDAFIERWRGAERPVNAPGLLITVDADHALPADATCFAKRDCVVLWKGFVPPEIVENLTRIEPRMFKDSNYSFMRIGGAEVKGDRVFRSFATHGMREGMRRMIAGENIQLGFDVKMADENPWLKNIGLELLAKVNAFDSSVMYLAQSFLYHGNQQQANLHNDPLSGFSIQLANSKLWRFVNPRHTPRVRPFRGDNPGVFYSDLCFLENGTIPFLEVLVEPGDMIFFPEHWWHEVHPVERTGFGMTVAYRELGFSKLLGPSAFLSSLPIFLHKVAALTDMIVNKRAADAPENL